ncbi:MAG: glycosyltransferase family A protein [Arenicellales bacterium]
MSSSPVVSVVIPAFNAAQTLREAVSSVLSQSFGALECLIVDDGSGDGTAVLASRLEREDKRVRVFSHQEHANRGVAASRNLAIDHARGNFIAFLDADDAWLGDKLEAQLEIMRAMPEVGLVFGDVYCSFHPQVSAPMACQELRRDPFRATIAEELNDDPGAAYRMLNLDPEPYRVIPSPTPLIRRSLLEDGLRFYGRPRLSLQYEDFLMWRILSTRTRFHCINRPLAIYRFHADSFTSRFHATKSALDHLVGLEEVQDVFLSLCKSRLNGAQQQELMAAHRQRIKAHANGVPWKRIVGLLGIAVRNGVVCDVMRARFALLNFQIRLLGSRMLHRLGVVG